MQLSQSTSQDKPEYLVCPECHAATLTWSEDLELLPAPYDSAQGLRCAECRREYPYIDGVWVMWSDDVRRIVLLSGRGEAEAQRCERIVQSSGVPTTVVRASWFAQNFDEGAFRDAVLAGEVALPAGDVLEPFVDIDDIAEVAVAALTEDGHAGEVYEVTGPRLLTFADAVAVIADATGREIRYTTIPREAFQEGLQHAGLPAQQIDLLDYLFTTVLDGRNAHTSDGIERALGRPARDFADYARAAASRGAWDLPVRS